MISLLRSELCLSGIIRTNRRCNSKQKVNICIGENVLQVLPMGFGKSPFIQLLGKVGRVLVICRSQDIIWD